MCRPKEWDSLKPQPHRPDYFYGDAEPAYIEGYENGVEAGADAITPGVAKAVYQLVMNDRYARVEFHKDAYPEFLAKLREFRVFIPEGL